jgi:hypothetical protein
MTRSSSSPVRSVAWNSANPLHRPSDQKCRAGFNEARKGRKRPTSTVDSLRLCQPGRESERCNTACGDRETRTRPGTPRFASCAPGVRGPLHPRLENQVLMRDFGPRNGERRTRTADTTIFSRESSTGECGRVAAESRARTRSAFCRGFPRFPRDCGPVRHTIANLCRNCFRGAAPCPSSSTCRATRPR